MNAALILLTIFNNAHMPCLRLKQEFNTLKTWQELLKPDGAWMSDSPCRTPQAESRVNPNGDPHIQADA